MNSKNCCLYTRVSTSEQSVDPQLIELRAYAAQHGFTVVKEYTDVISGAKAERPGLDELIVDAEAHRFGVVLAVKLDRLGRSVLNVVTLVQRLKALNVSVICTSQGIDNRDENPCGTMVMGIMASFAQFERDIIRERTKAGLAAAKLRGAKIGRPSPTLVAEPERASIIADWRASGKGYRKLAQKLGGVSPMTARKL